MQIKKETIKDIHQGWTTVGTTPVKLTNEIPALKGILLRCPGNADPDDSGNDTAVWIGGRNVTADQGPTGGITLLPGNAMYVPLESAHLLYVVSTMEDQKISWMVC